MAAADHRPGHDPPGGDELGIAVTEPIVWGRSTIITGRLRGRDNAAKMVRLEADPHPFADTGFAQQATATTDSNGDYRFVARPRLNTRYRVVAETAPVVTSDVALVRVRIRVSRAVSTTTPRRGGLVQFRGSACPEHDGRLAYIQRLSSDGAFRTIARTRLRDAGDTCSRYSRRIRVGADSTYRVRVLPRDADHATGVSRRITIRPR